MLMLFTNSKKGLSSVFRTFSSLKDQLPKDWAKVAEKELKGTSLEELIWHTPEVTNKKDFDFD